MSPSFLCYENLPSVCQWTVNCFWRKNHISCILQANILCGNSLFIFPTVITAILHLFLMENNPVFQRLLPQLFSLPFSPAHPNNHVLYVVYVNELLPWFLGGAQAVCLLKLSPASQYLQKLLVLMNSWWRSRWWVKYTLKQERKDVLLLNFEVLSTGPCEEHK